VLELRDLSKLLFGVLDSLVNELLSELVTGLDSGLNARDWVNSETEESCLTRLQLQKNTIRAVFNKKRQSNDALIDQQKCC
jgi:hypothetical protein